MFGKLLILITFCAAFCHATDPDSEIVNAFDEIEKFPKLYLFGGLSVVKTDSKPDVSAKAFDSNQVVQKVNAFFATHELKFDLEDVSNLKEESRKSRLQKLGLPLLLALKLKLSVLVPVMLKALTYLTVKAFVTTLFALVLSGSLLLKELLAKKMEKVTTAYITSGGPVGIEMENWNRISELPIAQEVPVVASYGPYLGFTN